MDAVDWSRDSGLFSIYRDDTGEIFLQKGVEGNAVTKNFHRKVSDTERYHSGTRT